MSWEQLAIRWAEEVAALPYAPHATLGLVLVCGAVWALRRVQRGWHDGRDGRVMRRRQERAERAEVDAAGVLRAHGYRVLDEQAELHWTVGLDGEPYPVELRADYLVERRGRRYVAEVKSGHSAPSLGTAATRRQLLEYRVAYEVEGVLLVDMEAVALHRVDFGDRVEGRESSSRVWRALIFGAGALTGAALTAAWLVSV